MHELHAAVSEAASWRLASQYLRIAQALPELLAELPRALHSAPTEHEQAEVAGLLASAFRSADAVAYKSGARDLSARLVELMRWAAGISGDTLLGAAAAYVRGETFFAARAHAPGLRAMQAAIDAAPAPSTPRTTAARGALHMRAAVLASRATNPDAATEHIGEARRLGDTVPEDVYGGTAFGPSSVRIHEVSLAVGLGGDHLQRALDVAREWRRRGSCPPSGAPASTSSWAALSSGPGCRMTRTSRRRSPGRSLRSTPGTPVGARGHRHAAPTQARRPGRPVELRRLVQRHLTR
ncbi:hypothetical protein RM572_02075 [Streptomyces sp. DSM 42041]|uniref:Transcriptional regulator n=1 Tax=Streptomyces hazeniae TaxID=3075538 RepID=A0ABU2NKR5_9ACTN|nr:hypothetical protein [Streptomyces sp. DSM 42041]MDT0377562.1 hypothetical protein [Streptomyces sp. DSM 42041]